MSDTAQADHTPLDGEEVLRRLRSFNNDFDDVHPLRQLMPVCNTLLELCRRLPPDQRTAVLVVLEALSQATDNVTRGYASAASTAFDFAEQIIVKEQAAATLRNQRDQMADAALKLGMELRELKTAIRNLPGEGAAEG